MLRRSTCAILAVAFLSCTPPAHPASGPIMTSEETRCTIWNREVSFAKSALNHDASAFAEHILDGAVFVTGAGIFRGRDAIVKASGSLLHGENTRFEWHPTDVEITGDPRVAMCRGPAFIEMTAPDGSKKLLLGGFQSTWVLDKDGAWRVAIDGGTPYKEVSREEIEKVKASIPTSCPPETR